VSHVDAHEQAHPFMQHHWETPKQQFEAGKLGMWLFLATEVLLFGGLFCAYTIWRYLHPEMFKFGSEFLDTTMGAVNTAVLIASSLTMATAVTMAQRSNQKGLLICLVLTLAGAFGFLVIKYFEYTHKFHEGWYPGIHLYEKPAHAEHWEDELGITGVEMTTVDPSVGARTAEDLGLPADLPVEISTVAPPTTAESGLNPSVLNTMEQQFAGHAPEVVEREIRHPLQTENRPANAHMFFNIYFMMTGLHGIHVGLGIIVITWLIIKTLKGHFNKDYFTPVDLGGLYWHVVDLIWIFLFPLFYLI